MLETFVVATFSGRVGETFRLSHGAAAPVVARLVSVTPLGDERGAATPRGRRPFSLEFRGPLQPVLPQRTYRVDHDELGTFDLFLVPIGPDADGMRYEAIFT